MATTVTVNSSSTGVTVSTCGGDSSTWSPSITSKTITSGIALTATDLDNNVLLVESRSGTKSIGSLASPSNSYHEITLVGQSDTNTVVIPTSISNLFSDVEMTLAKGDHVTM